jgi:hypothetical protein
MLTEKKKKQKNVRLPPKCSTNQQLDNGTLEQHSKAK